MGNKHRKTTLDRARDELMSHVMRCKVLDARMEDRHAWLDDTLEYLRDRHPNLGTLEAAQLELIGRQFIQPAIPHGAGNSALNRPEATVLTVDGHEILESEADAWEEDAAEEGVETPELQPA